MMRPVKSAEMKSHLPPSLMACSELPSAVLQSEAKRKLGLPPGGAVVMVIDRDCVSLCPSPLCTRTVKMKVPAVVGVPLITPVPAAMSSPFGSDPAEIDQV